MFGAQGRIRIALAACVMLEVAFGLYGLDQPIRFGHQGYHVAEHGLGARNLRRHGAWTFTTYHGSGSPPPSALDFHHPVMLAAPVALVQSIFGEEPWTARVVGLALSLVALAGLWAFWRRARDPTQATLAVALFVLSPMHVAFGNLPDVQILGIAAMLWLSAALLGFVARPSRRGALGLAALTVVGALSDWAWTPTALLALAALGLSARAAPSADAPGRAAPVRTIPAVFAGLAVLVVLVLAQHFLRAARADRLGDLFVAYEGRRASSPLLDFAGLAARRLVQHHTAPVLAAAAFWLWDTLRRRPPWSGGSDPASAVVAAWLVAQTIYFLAFRNEFEFHEYRSYWLVAPLACATADVLWRASAALAPRWPRLVPLLPLVAVALLATRAVPMLVHSRAVSGSTSMSDYDPRTGVTAAALVARALAPPGTPVLVGAGPGGRLEVHWLLDRPSWTADNPREVVGLIRRFPTVTVLEERAILTSSPSWHKLLRSAAVVLIDDLAVAVFRRGGTASIEDARWRERRTYGPWLRWLRAPARGPLCIRPGEPAAAERFAEGTEAPPAVRERARRGRAPLARALPESLRCPTEGS